MSVHKCCRNKQQTLQVRQRYIPTFVHQPIFEDAPLKPHLSRYIPTFCSSVLDTQGYNIKTVHHKKQKEIARPSTAVEKTLYINHTHQKRIQDLNPHFYKPYDTRDNWYDHTKEHLLDQIKKCKVHGYSKERKYVDLSSDPVFTDFNYGAQDVFNPPSNLYAKGATNVICSNQVCINNLQHRNQQLINNQAQTNQKIQHQISPQAQQIPAPELDDSLDIHNKQTKPLPQRQIKKIHKNSVPQNTKQLTLKGKKINQRPQSAQKPRIVLQKPKVISQKPTFTVIRKSRIPQA